MCKKEFLKQISQINQVILCNQQELEALTEQSTCIKAVDYARLRVRESISSGEAKFTGIIADMMLLEEQIKKDTEKMLELKQSVRSSIENLENMDERLILQRRYILGETWKEVAGHMELSIAAVYRVHSSALDHLEMKFDNN